MAGDSHYRGNHMNSDMTEMDTATKKGLLDRYDSDYDQNYKGMGDQPESENLLSAPVKLSPGWEDTMDKSAEELNFKNLERKEDTVPIDRWRIVYFILLLHGIATLMPWNMFITANSYFVDYKLAGNETDVVKYRNYFLSFLGFAAQIPNVILNGLNVFLQCKGGNTGIRIVWTIIIIVIMFIITVFLAMIDSSGSTEPEVKQTLTAGVFSIATRTSVMMKVTV
ncbi:hypothetical protein LSAT2_000950 [Lamellibrachia satsuma]|nr:hypothetical protein LSAT2_000950 [Lamellibrachia satsuma]